MFALLFPPPFFLAYGMVFLKAATTATTDASEKEGGENPVLLYVNDDGDAGAGTGDDLERGPTAGDGVRLASGRLSGRLSARLSAKLDGGESGAGAGR